MSQIKDAGLDGYGARIGALLARRARLLEELARVDADLLELRTLTARAASKGEAAGGDGDLQWFPLRGEEIARGGFAVPAGLDRDDLRRRLDKIMIDERRGGRRIDGLELLIAYQAASGRVQAVQTRRSGETTWLPRFEANGVV